MRKVLLFALVGLLITGAGAWAQFPITVRAGDDSWVTPAGGTQVSFSSTNPDLPPLPAGFFGPGSLSWSGRVSFQGKPLTTNPAGALGRADTLVQRQANAVFNGFGTVTVPIQLQALSLVSTRPINVNFSDGHTEQWNVKLTLSTVATQPSGSMAITLNCLDGGTFTSNLPVLPRFIFTRGNQTRILDCGNGNCNATNLSSIDGCWQRIYRGSPFNAAACNVSPLPPNVQVDGDCNTVFDYTTIGRRDFLPGFDGCADPAGCTQCLIVEDKGPSMHTVEPATGCADGSEVEPVDSSTADSDISVEDGTSDVEATACPTSTATKTTVESFKQ